MPKQPPPMTTHHCKHCGAVLAMIDDRTRYQRFALRCVECGAHLVLRPLRETPVYITLTISALDNQQH
jgi:hypothetical protein